MSLIESVCVVHELHPDDGNRSGQTAIDKRPVSGPVAVGPLGLEGDRQMDVDHHGGHQQAVYAYAGEDASWWAGRLNRDIPAGHFGENLRTTGVDVSGAVIGERWRIGGEDGVVLEVTCPRIPCSTFQAWMDEPQWVKRFTEHGAPGAYLSVVSEGSVREGDRLEIVRRPMHGVTIRDCFPRVDGEPARRLLDAHAAGEVEVDPELLEWAERAVARA